MRLNGINILQGFNLASAEIIDSRLVLTKADMALVGDPAYQSDPDSVYNLGKWPDYYFVLCEDDGELYEFHQIPGDSEHYPHSCA